MGISSLQTELAAARAVAAKAGIATVEPKLLKVAKHASVKLGAAPIVARIASANQRSHSELAFELEIGRYLASHAAPTVCPTAIIEPGPHVENGCAMTMWDFVDGRSVETAADELMAARALRRVHDVLEDIDAELPSFTVAIDSVGRILSNSSAAPKLRTSDLLFLKGLYAKLRQEMAGLTMVCRPIHGDTHLNNVLITSSGAVWMDLESVCMGPVEWDVVTLPASTWSEFNGINAELMRLLGNVRSLCVAAWCWRDFDRTDEIREAATFHLSDLKARFT